MKKSFTIGMAGHIDHGKTALTKALTGVDTDRLQAERKRKISIEPGFAPFMQTKEIEVSIIDVPGHEKFIRQMIAGVAGIDLVILVIAADEGVMPQTKEHLQILSLLGIKKGMIVFTKMAEADQELLEIIKEDVKQEVRETFLKNAPIFYVDNLSGDGIDKLKQTLTDQLQQMRQQEIDDFFRMPIDDVFTVKGQGVVVRGTIANGKLTKDEELTLLPANQRVRARQIQRHHKPKETAYQGQRTAINLAGIKYSDVKRGNVLTSNDLLIPSQRIDIAFSPLNGLKHSIKQRQLIKLHIGTSEVMGKIIFFDRNEISHHNLPEEIVCQLELHEHIVALRGDRLIIRRPTPAETIGGGWVIDAQAEKHPFGKQTITDLKVKKEGSLKEQIHLLLAEHFMLSKSEMMQKLSLSEQEFAEGKSFIVALDDHVYTSTVMFEQLKGKIFQLIQEEHQQYPLRKGMNKAEIISALSHYPEQLLDKVLQILERQNILQFDDAFVSLPTHTPTLPKEWEETLHRLESTLIKENLGVSKWKDLCTRYDVSHQIGKDFYHYLLDQQRAYLFDDERIVAKDAVTEALTLLKEQTNRKNFTIQDARNILQLTRKNLIPFLELLDKLGYTKRVGNERTWL